MGEKSKRIEGQCLCGAVTVQATPVRRHVEACHCTMCRRWGEIDGGEHVVRYRSSEWAERGFCGRCGSNLFFHYLPNGNHGFLAGLFPDDTLLPLSEEIFIDQKPGYYAFAGDAGKLTRAEVLAKFGVGESGGG